MAKLQLTWEQMGSSYGSEKTGERVELFGVKDKKGREVGARAILRELTRADSGERVYGYVADAQRAGKSFGAMTVPQWFATAAERDAAVVKYLKGAKARAIKTFGGEWEPVDNPDAWKEADDKLLAGKPRASLRKLAARLGRK